MSRESKRSSLLGTSLRISRAACFPMGRGVRVHAVVHRAGLWIVSRDEDNFYRVTGEEGGERINNENFSIVYVYKINHEEAKRDFCETGIVVFFTKDLYSITLVSFPPFFFLNYVKWKRENSPRKTTKFSPLCREFIPVYQRSRFLPISCATFHANIFERSTLSDPRERKPIFPRSIRKSLTPPPVLCACSIKFRTNIAKKEKKKKKDRIRITTIRISFERIDISIIFQEREYLTISGNQSDRYEYNIYIYILYIIGGGRGMGKKKKYFRRICCSWKRVELNRVCSFETRREFWE